MRLKHNIKQGKRAYAGQNGHRMTRMAPFGSNLQVRRVSPLEIDQIKSSGCHMPGKNTTQQGHTGPSISS